MEIQTNKSLLKYNTFGINVSASYFSEITRIEELQSILEDKSFKKTEKLVLGGGSNILFTKDFDGLVLKNNLTGIKILSESSDHIILEVGAGQNWHEFVLHCVNNDYAGVENLSLIPGNVGASPMQNIGAYGVEVKDVVQNVNYLDLGDLKLYNLKADQCAFGYRSSIFKNELKNRTFITSVVFKLKKGVDKLNTSYGAIERELETLKLSPSIKNISTAVINIRQSKLPDPNKIGNAGSFFKNPLVDIDKAKELQKAFPEIPLYPAGDSFMKAAAGWLIEQAGWKGKRIDDYGVHKKQALVLVNYANSKGSDINALADKIKVSILEKFGIELEKEVNIL